MTDVLLTSLFDSYYPADEATSIPLLEAIEVLFTCEMDEDSVENNFHVEGPNQDTWSGPDVRLWNRGTAYSADKEDLFTSTEYGGIVEGTISFSRINASDPSAYSGFDYSGLGTAFRTKVTFTPTRPMVNSTTYHVRMVGKDSGDNIGARKRSVFDTKKETGVGTAECTFAGSYTATGNDTFNVQLASSGIAGIATYRWWKSSAPHLIYGPITTTISQKSLTDGVKVSFGNTGSFSTGDLFSAVVKVPDEGTGLVSWSFTTGTGQILSVPSTVSTSVIGLPSAAIDSGITFAVDSTSPANRDSRINISRVSPINVVFTKALGTVAQDMVKVSVEAVSDDPAISVPDFSDDLPKRLVVDDKTLSIYL